jgi:Fe-S oxidoreductase
MQRAPENRIAWSQDLDLAELSRVRKTDILYFVGCLPSYDPRNQHVAKAIAHIFRTMEVDFAILGTEEWCCGDHILRLGQKALYARLAEHLVSQFTRYDFKRLVTISPHCYHTFSTMPPYTDLNLNVQHYTQLFATAILNGRLQPVKAIDKTVTYHDPCFLGKRSDIYDPPRDILRSIPGLDLVEMERSRVTSFCCGGGAGRMWTEIAPVDKRPGVHRVREALTLGVDVIATACPFCITTLEEAVKALDVQETLAVRGVAELLGDALDVSESQKGS